MKKDILVVDIYNKIHNKKPLTMDDLRYLAEYAPECFDKTCAKVINSMPEAKPIMEPVKPQVIASTQPNLHKTTATSHRYNIDDILANLKLLEANAFPISDLDADNVKNLLGNTYMELLVQHSDHETIANMMGNSNKSLFDAKI